jgi:hypothetical protein
MKNISNYQERLPTIRTKSGLAVFISVSALWIASFLLTFTFPTLNRRLGSAGTFWIYAAICLFGFFFVLARIPETRGKTLEEIEHDWPVRRPIPR